MSAGKKHAGASVPMHYECSVHGLLTKSNEPLFRTRLEALCGDTESAHCELHHEISCVPCVETPIGPLRREDHMLRLRMELDPSDPQNTDKCKNMVCMLGHPEPRSGRGASVRPAIYAQVFSGNAPRFLSLLGYKFHSEYVRKGYWFLYRSMFKIIVSQIYRLDAQGDIQSAQAVDPSESWVVHVVADALTQDQVPRLCEQLDELKRLFADYVELVVVDHAFLENKIPYN